MSEDSPKEPTVEERLAKLRSVNPKRRLYIADSPAGILIFGAPKPSDYEMYLTLALSDEAADKVTARKTLLRMCAADPDLAGIEALLLEYPGLPGNTEVQNACAKSTGVVKGETAKK